MEPIADRKNTVAKWTIMESYRGSRCVMSPLVQQQGSFHFYLKNNNFNHPAFLTKTK